jgi:hypothetical protein
LKEWPLVGEQHDWFCEYAYCLAGMGRLQAAAGRRDEAGRALEEARKIVERAQADTTGLPDLPRCVSLALGQIAALIGLGRAERTASERAERDDLADQDIAALRQAAAG